jgi:hypothetical protein
MAVDGEVCDLANGSEDLEADADIGNVDAVHNVEVDHICACFFSALNLGFDIEKICGKKAGGS